ncbi:hypothetical protein ACFLQV_04910 [Calditrichota bacterium]
MSLKVKRFFLLSILIVISFNAKLFSQDYINNVYYIIKPVAPIEGDSVKLFIYFELESNNYSPMLPEVTLDEGVIEVVIKANDMNYFPANVSFHVDTTFQELPARIYNIVTYSHLYGMERVDEDWDWEISDTLSIDTLHTIEFVVHENYDDFPDIEVAEFKLLQPPFFQQGDSFRVSYSMKNVGSSDIEDSTYTSLRIRKNYDTRKTSGHTLFSEWSPSIAEGEEHEFGSPYIVVDEEEFYGPGLHYLTISLNYYSLVEYFALFDGRSRLQEYYTENNYATIPIWIGDPVEHEIELKRGWNLVGSHLMPLDNSMQEIFTEQIEDGIVQLIKSTNDGFCVPWVDYYRIPYWNPLEAYWVKMSEASTLTITGYPLPPETPIPLRQGWNAVSYLPEDDTAAPIAFAGIEAYMTQAKNGTGSFYVPAWSYNCLPPCTQGSGYMLRMTQATELVWRTE